MIIKDDCTVVKPKLIKEMNRSIPESVRLKEKRDAILKAQQMAEAISKENVWNFDDFVIEIE